MSELSRLSEQERADIVAYLDGELNGEAARRIEHRIAREPKVREEAEAMRRAWELLDFLPAPEPSEHFANRTLDRVAPVTLTTVAAVPRRSRSRWLIALGWGAAASVALWLGYAVTQRRVPREPGEQELVRDLRVIENKRLYDSIEDLDFVRELDVPDLFGDDTVGT